MKFYKHRLRRTKSIFDGNKRRIIEGVELKGTHPKPLKEFWLVLYTTGARRGGWVAVLWEIFRGENWHRFFRIHDWHIHIYTHTCKSFTSFSISIIMIEFAARVHEKDFHSCMWNSTHWQNPKNYLDILERKSNCVFRVACTHLVFSKMENVLLNSDIFNCKILYFNWSRSQMKMENIDFKVQISIILLI